MKKGNKERLKEIDARIEQCKNEVWRLYFDLEEDCEECDGLYTQLAREEEDTIYSNPKIARYDGEEYFRLLREYSSEYTQIAEEIERHEQHIHNLCEEMEALEKEKAKLEE